MTDIVSSTDKNQVFLVDQGYIEARLVGDQTDVTFRHLYNAVEPLLEKLRAKGKPIKGLIDMTEETGYSIASDKAALELLESIQYDKLAMCNPPYAGVAQGIVLAMGRGDNTKVFSSREDALQWLLAED